MCVMQFVEARNIFLNKNLGGRISLHSTIFRQQTHILLLYTLVHLNQPFDLNFLDLYYFNFIGLSISSELLFKDIDFYKAKKKKAYHGQKSAYYRTRLLPVLKSIIYM